MRPRWKARRLAAIAALAVALVGAVAAAHTQNPNALWQIVHGRCVPEQQQHRDLTPPCVAVDLREGYAVIKDRNGTTQFLLIPTERISGIESRALLAPHAVNYFAKAWQARRFVDHVLGHDMARATLSLAVNSEHARSQNQLHIHIDCVRADVRDALLRQRATIGGRWVRLKTPFGGHDYRALRVRGASLAGHNPFKLLASGIPGARAAMGQYTLVVVGMRFAGNVPGFVILEDRADPAHGDNAGGEELQDHACALARLVGQAR
ncbi:MAG: CDP-diacylglycerol diphosphatase [Xanthobacteraceae bacterium]